MNNHLAKAAELEAQSTALEAEAAAIDAEMLPDRCDLNCAACRHKPHCDEVTQRLGKAYILRQRAANLRKA